VKILARDIISCFSTKIFIRLPKVLFATEELFAARKHELATSIQAKFKGHYQRKSYLRMKVAVIMIAKHWRRVLAKRLLEKRKWATLVVRKYVCAYKCNQPAHILRHICYLYESYLITYRLEVVFQSLNF